MGEYCAAVKGFGDSLASLFFICLFIPLVCSDAIKKVAIPVRIKRYAMVSVPMKWYGILMVLLTVLLCSIAL